MKNKIISVLKNQEINNELRYAQLLELMRSTLSVGQLRNFQSGYSEYKLERLIYETKKLVPITDLEIHNYVAEEVFEASNDNLEVNDAAVPKGDNETGQDIFEDTPFIKELKANEDAKEGLKLREEYPFLSNPNCPPAFHILVGEKITAWEEFAKNRSFLDILGVMTPEDVPAEVLELKIAYDLLSDVERASQLRNFAKQAVDNFQLNSDIKAELDFYKEQGKVLGNHPALNDLKIEQEISELDEAGLVEMKTKASKNVSKAKKEVEAKGTNEAREKRIHDWGLRQKLTEARLENEFPKK